jgi:hypothetical protein
MATISLRPSRIRLASTFINKSEMDENSVKFGKIRTLLFGVIFTLKNIITQSD